MFDQLLNYKVAGVGAVIQCVIQCTVRQYGTSVGAISLATCTTQGMSPKMPGTGSATGFSIEVAGSRKCDSLLFHVRG